MTFEIEFQNSNVLFKADVTLNGKDFLVNLVSPVHYETAPTMTFTVHEDGSMKYGESLFEDKGFMPAIETAITNYIHSNNITVE